MHLFVHLSLKRNRGWPWPEQSFGLGSIYGSDGWCRNCGVPQVQQQGALVLQRKGLDARGGWVPHWLYDHYCVSDEVRASLGAFRIGFREVQWRGDSPGHASHIAIPELARDWFEPAQLAAASMARNQGTGADCSVCGVWRWLSIPVEQLPPITLPANAPDTDVLISREWFGDGLAANRQWLFRRELAEALVATSPRDFFIDEANLA